MRVICTAGHVDHGKSSLVEALTGINPDRLIEEREREMTIDLGFASIDLDGVGSVGVVDVPGHRDFVENMLAGVSSVDAALLVVAADEGLMPQTYEHVAILDLLQIDGGVVALTKTDVVESEDWLHLVSEDVVGVLSGTIMDRATIVPVSSRTGAGIKQLQEALVGCLVSRPERVDLGRPRLSIDRVFTMAGFGTVVTGTLVGGSLKVGDEVTILPSGQMARIRGLQTHHTQVDTAFVSSRVAINLSGVEAGNLCRGEVVTKPDMIRATSRIDVHFRHLDEKHGARPLTHNTDLKLFVGAAEVMARARLLSHERLPPGEVGWLQLDLREPVVVAKGDHFILRRPSPPATIGGGMVIDAHPRGRHRLQDARVLSRLETASRGTPGEVLLQSLESIGPTQLRKAVEISGLDDKTALAAVSELVLAGDLMTLASTGDIEIPDDKDLVVSRAVWMMFVEQAIELAREYHDTYPLRTGIPREELKSRLSLNSSVFNALVARADCETLLVDEGSTVRTIKHRVEFTPVQQGLVDKLVERFRLAPCGSNTPSRKDVIEEVGLEMLAVLINHGIIVSVSQEVLLLSETYDDMVAVVRDQISVRGTTTVAEVRDLLATSRKYALALLEHMDYEGITVRQGDQRALR